MRKALFIAAIIFIAASCQEKKTSGFTVTGVIEHATGKKVMLMEIPYGTPNPIVLDSATLDEKGKFSLKAIGKQEAIYRVALENGPDVIVINDTRNINIKMDVNNYRHYTVEGSPASESLHNLFEDYSQKDSILLVTFRELDTLQKQTGSDSLVEMFKARRDSELKVLNNTVKDFISKSESPAARFYAIGLASRTMPPEEIKPLVDEAAAKFKDHEGIVAIKKMVDAQSVSKPPAYKLANQPAPEITMPDVNGKTVTLSSFKGKYVLVDFWASWCGPCRKENPNVVAAYNKFKAKNFTILGVSLDQDKAAWLSAIAHDKLAWTQISDLKQWDSEAVPAYGIEGIPFNVLVDPDGKIVASNLRGEALEMKLAEVLK